MNNNNKNRYVFILGREQELALEEIRAVLERFCFSFDIYKITGNAAFAKIENFSDDDAKTIINVLAGTMKIFRLNRANHLDHAKHVEKSSDYVISPTVRQDSQSRDNSNMLEHSIVELVRELMDNRENKFNFGISDYQKLGRSVGQQVGSLNKLGISVKIALKQSGLKPRFVELRGICELSSIQTLKNNLLGKGIEVGLFNEGVGYLVALNNPEKWAKIDYGKPASDKFSGMLPPRLARTMVNMALGEIPKSHCEPLGKTKGDAISQNVIENWKLKTGNCNDVVIVDPFCGSGNVLLEALQLGLPAVGSDISEKAVSDSKTNLDWFVDQSKVESRKFKVFQADATNINYIAKLKDAIDKINAYKLIFVAEPYLGRPKKFQSSYNATVAEYKVIKELYLSFLKNIYKFEQSVILSEVEGSFNGKISPTVQQSSQGRNDKEVTLCLVFPLVETSDGKRFSLFRESVDEIEKIGYTQIRPSFIYGRDYQVVKREIVLLSRKNQQSIKKQ